MKLLPVRAADVFSTLNHSLSIPSRAALRLRDLLPLPGILSGWGSALGNSHQATY